MKIVAQKDKSHGAELKQWEKVPGKQGIILGNFDGVHLGHQALLKEMRFACDKLGLQLGVLTFRPHPRAVLEKCSNGSGNSSGDDFLITTGMEKRQYLAELGLVDNFYEFAFTPQLGDLSPQEFIQEHLLDPNLSLAAFFMGHDFRFGREREGDRTDIEKIFRAKGIETSNLSVFHLGEETVSSTTIRHYLEQGLVEKAGELLGRPFVYEGVVGEYRGLGKSLGFPTANIPKPPGKILLRPGVYFSHLTLRGVTYPALTNVGYNPTVSDQQALKTIKIETHILDFNSDIVGETVIVGFLHRIRDEKKFANLEELKAQIAADVVSARNYHSINRP